jgi:hypothetical protein
MRRKVGWLFIWTNLVFWLGQAGGCSTPWENQNYKIADEPAGIDPSVPIEPAPRVERLRVEADPEPKPPGAPAPAPAEAPPAAPIDAPSAPPAVTAEAAPPPNPPANPPANPVAGADAAPSDRSGWTLVTVSTASGATTHGPLYFKDQGFTHRDFSPPPQPAAPESALRGPDASGWSGQNLAAMVVEPFNFLVDFIVFPVRAVLQSPFKTVTTP